MSNHKWSHHFIKPEDYKHVEAAIGEAEKSTSGEIVPMIVKSSTASGTLPTLIVFAILALGFLAKSYFPKLEASVLSISLFLILTLAASYLLSHLSFIQRWLLPKHDQHWQVHQRAFAEFSHRHIDHTINHTGILIFVSLMERQVVVLADSGIASKLPNETWNGVVQIILKDIKRGKPCDGIVNGVKACGEILAKHFPPSDHKNELRNRLIVKE